MEMRRPEVKFTLRPLYLQTKSFLPPVPTSCIVRKNQVFYTSQGHIIFLTDRIIFHMPSLVTTCYAFYCCCKIHPFVLHHIKIDIAISNSRLYRFALSLGTSVYFSVLQIGLCFDSPHSKKALEVVSFGSQLRFSSRLVL